MKKIDLMIAGAQKAGTTSLLRYLGQHPKICTHFQIELGYFILDEQYKKGETFLFSEYFKDCNSKDKIVAKNIGIMYEEKAMERLKKHNSNVHIVLILRNPVERAYSAYWYARRKGWENLKTFEEAIEAEPKRLKEDPFKWRHCAYLERGKYIKYIKKLQNYYPKENIHIFFFEELKKNPLDIYKKTLEILNIPFHEIKFKRKHNQAAIARFEFLARIINKENYLTKVGNIMLPRNIRKKTKLFIEQLNKKQAQIPEINTKTKEFLKDFYKNYNLELSKEIKKDLSIWL